MKVSDEHNQRVTKLIFASVYPLYIVKIERKDRSIEELNQIIEWLTGFDTHKLQELID